MEATNHNDGPVVEKFLSAVGRKKGDSWCAAFVSYCLKAGNAKFPKVCSGLARDFKLRNSFKANDVLIGKYKILSGTIIVWQKGSTVFGHVGFVELWKTQNGITIEGNTSGGCFNTDKKTDESNGDGVYRRNRSIQPGNYFRITCFTEVRT